MEREIWEIVKILDEGKLTTIEAYKKLCDSLSVIGSMLLNDLIKEGEEVIMVNGLRFTGIHEEKIKQVFDKYGIKFETMF